jgi:CRP/FNR family transcriptional activator FtrB
MLPMIDRRNHSGMPAPFHRLSPAVRARLMHGAVTHTVAAGTVLFEQGETPAVQHVVLSGSVHLLGCAAQREVLIEVVKPVNLLAPAAVLTRSPYLMRGRTPETSRLLLLNAATFRTMAAQDAVLAAQVFGSLALECRHMIRQLKNLKLRTATERVGCHILSLSKQQGTPRRAILPYEKALIASELGMTRESFSRALSTLRRHGIKVKDNAITIADPGRLKALVNVDPLIDEPDVSPRRRGTPRLRRA